MPLTIKPKQDCRWDLVALGEVMLRFDPGDKRVATARSFDVYEGGGEYNVARGLKRCFGARRGFAAAVLSLWRNEPWREQRRHGDRARPGWNHQRGDRQFFDDHAAGGLGYRQSARFFLVREPSARGNHLWGRGQHHALKATTLDFIGDHLLHFEVTMFVKPGPRQDDRDRQLVVRGPNGRVLSPIGENVPDTQFWIRPAARWRCCRGRTIRRRDARRDRQIGVLTRSPRLQRDQGAAP